jgi:hypothetical protein
MIVADLAKTCRSSYRSAATSQQYNIIRGSRAPVMCARVRRFRKKRNTPRLYVPQASAMTNGRDFLDRSKEVVPRHAITR